MSAEDSVGLFMVGVFTSIVVGDGLAQARGYSRESTGEGDPHGMSGLCGELGNTRIAGLPLDGDLQCSFTLSRHCRICFPVAGTGSKGSVLWTLHNRDSVGNMGLFVLSAVSTSFSLLVGSHQVWDEVSGIHIDPLIDRLVADGVIGMECVPASRSEFG